MSASNKQKNTVEGTSIEAQGDVTIGDRKTINVYGMETNSRDIEFVMKFFMVLMGVFAIACVTFLVLNPKNIIASFAAGGFFVLLALLIVVLIRSRQHPHINVK
jgi:hypothetical protein